MNNNLSRTITAWNGEAPGWVLALARACDETNQTVVARRIGYSPALVNQVLKGVYGGDMSRVEALVRGAYLGAVVDCPAIGEIPVDRCLTDQKKPYSATNAQRVRQWRACRSGCPNYKGDRHAP